MAGVLHDTGRDVRHGLRVVRRRPGFAATVVIMLALGIGASTSIFSAVDGIVFRPLAYEEPEQLVTVWETYPMWRGRPVLDAHWDQIGLAWPDYVEWRDRQRAFTAVAIYAEGAVTLLEGGEAERLDAVAVSASLSGSNHSYAGVARLRPAIPLAQALAETEQVLRGDRAPGRLGARVVPLRESIIADARPPLLLLLDAAGVLLVISCINVATLLLSEASHDGRR